MIMRFLYRHIISFLVFCLLLSPLCTLAQSDLYESVLSQGTWYKMAVAKDGVYKLDYNLFQSLGVSMIDLNPDQIRIFGNESSPLPEKNSVSRYEDLTELAIFVYGAEDGHFDANDYVLFYGQDPTNWTISGNEDPKFVRERNCYSDTTYYYLCTDSGVNGLRIGHAASVDYDQNSHLITRFPDFQGHDEDLLTLTSIGRVWYGEMLTTQDPSLDLPFVFPDLIDSLPVSMTVNVMGKTKSILSYNVWYNSNQLVLSGRILKPSTHTYGNISTYSRQFNADSDTLSLRLEMLPNMDGGILFLDYFELQCWRKLKYHGDDYYFQFFPNQFDTLVNLVEVEDVPNRFELWDVTNPLRPIAQDYEVTGNRMRFAVEGQAERRYMIFVPNAFKQVESVKPIHNQNLHAISTADMLIITPRLFWEQAQELADFHTETDELLTVVADVDEIKNEFSTGQSDPSGIRDFIRMVYLRSAGRLKYVLLFGKPSMDYRDIMGYGNNMVSCYESRKNSVLEVACYASDDFFGLMGEDEGDACYGFVDLGIGRLPVTTVEQAQNVVNKIKHYQDVAETHGPWRIHELIMADDEESHFNQAETCAEIVADNTNEILQTKLYIDAYRQVSTAGGDRYPEANADLIRYLEEGQLVFRYSGHGGVNSLTEEKVFTDSDIMNMTNGDRLPFFYSATCEFSRYDKPSLVSAGEMLVLKPDGGAIATFSATRSTFPGDNLKLSKSLSEVLFQSQEGFPLRFGDVFRMAKSNSDLFSTNNVCYVLLGDPALRMAYPQQKITISSINGRPIDDGVDLYAMSHVTVEGEVIRGDGACDSLFNGIMQVEFYDKKSVFTTLANDAPSVVISPRAFSYYHDILFSGTVTVRNGKFNFTFQIPSDINMNEGAPLLSYYAYDSVRNIDACGAFKLITLTGFDPEVISDHEGPQINLYWNTPDFVNGDVLTKENGVLYAELFDEQGIYHYDYSIGRDIVLNSNISDYQNYRLNDRFEPALDDFQRGRVVVPIDGLQRGSEYEFTLKAWDTQNNSSEASVWFSLSDYVFLSQVTNYPNPFSNETVITFVHDRPDEVVEVRVEVYDMVGHKVADLSRTVVASGDAVETIRWNGSDCASGLYVYRFTITDSEGRSHSVNRKMVIQR